MTSLWGSLALVGMLLVGSTAMAEGATMRGKTKHHVVGKLRAKGKRPTMRSGVKHLPRVVHKSHRRYKDAPRLGR